MYINKLFNNFITRLKNGNYGKFLKIRYYGLKILEILLSTSLLTKKSLLSKCISSLLYRFYKLKFLRVEWLDKYQDCEKKLLRAGSKSFAYAPNNDNKIIEQEVYLPNIFCYFLKNSIISNNSSSFIKGNTIVIERLEHIIDDIVNYTTGHLKVHKKSIALVNYTRPEIIDKGIFLAGNGSHNYYHWLIEILTKLEFDDQLPNDQPLLVSDSVKKFSSFKDSLLIIAPGRELIYLSSKKQYCVKNMTYITAPNNLPYNLKSGIRFKTTDFLFSVTSLSFLKSTFLTRYIIKKQTYKRIFLKRNDVLRPYNQRDVELRLHDLGFKFIECEKLSFLEQVEIFNNADLIVGPTGAAWTNLIFCRPFCKALCWMAEEYGSFSVFSTIAHLFQVDLRYFYYKTDAKSTGELYNKKYQIDMVIFERQLAHLL